MNDNHIVDLSSKRELREIEESIRNEIQLAKSELIRDLQKKEEYLTHLIRVLIAKIDALEQERNELVNTKPKNENKRLFRLY